MKEKLSNQKSFCKEELDKELMEFLFNNFARIFFNFLSIPNYFVKFF